MGWLIAPIIRHFDTPSHTSTWHHAMTTTLPRPDDTNDSTTGASRATMPRIEIGIGAIVITIGDDIRGMFFRSWKDLPPHGPSTACLIEFDRAGGTSVRR
ncbi:MAG: hypothetical protein V3T53_15645 [Phycisphaerales bacterium]